LKPEELRGKVEADLQTQALEIKEELFKLRLQKSTGQLEKSHRLKELRKDLARTYTVLNEKKEKEHKA
jgi:large subunit ribosomal protein L29